MIAPWKNEKIKRAYSRPEIQASIEIILSVFTVVFLLFLAIRPTLATVATLQKKIEDQDLVNRKLTTKIAQLLDAQKDLATYADRLADFTSAVPDAHDQGGLAKRVEILARENGLFVNSLVFEAVPLLGGRINLSDRERGGGKEPNRDGTVANFDVSFDASGSPEQVLAFLTTLEKVDRLVLVKSIDIKTEEFRPVNSDTLVKGVRAMGKGTSYYVFKLDQ